MDQQILQSADMEKFFSFIKMQINRGKMRATFIAMKPLASTDKMAIEQMLLETSRADNVYFRLTNDVVGVFLYETTEKEAHYYVKRLKQAYPTLTWCAGICEMNSIDDETDAVADEIIRLVENPEMPYVRTSDRYKKRPRITQKISIVEANEVARNMLKTAIQAIEVENTDILLETFEDGEAFMSSDWHKSYHPHIVILNMQLPRKNGLQVTSELRALPNDRKFTIFLISRLLAAEDQMTAYEVGVDAYIVRPFHLAVLCSQIKQKLKRRG